MPCSMYQAWRCWHQYSYHCWLSSGGTKYSISICSNSRVRNTKFPGVISLRNDLPTWAMPNGGFLRDVSSTFLKLRNMPCAVSGRRYTSCPAPSTGPAWVLNMRLNWRASVKVSVLAAARAGVRVVELVEPEPLLALLAVDERVGEVRQVAGRLPHRRRAEDRRVEADDVVAQLHHRPPPGVLHVAEHQHAERPVVVGGPEAAVDLGAREHEAAALAQVDDLVEQRRIRRGRHGRRLPAGSRPPITRMG